MREKIRRDVPASEQASKRASEQASKRASEQASKRASEQASKRASEQASKRVTFYRHMENRIGQTRLYSPGTTW